MTANAAAARAFVARNASKLELTALKMRGIEVYAKSIMRMIDLMGSSGKAWIDIPITRKPRCLSI